LFSRNKLGRSGTMSGDERNDRLAGEPILEREFARYPE
jgi:hypothetical protein